ncbi:hypothetical protein EJV47_09490 [Hymenobacter gummosus]|uniref:Uncharacterized protein n=1 Tax=Hymenobacter gummosus TaxID=1776032 RepID=A0A3S0HAD8_9BACT|nr:hypothetical protein [Hymenobacter gummosus]RTQ50839.1 hypothetical protein EJV47_09490 [Hymenobacter gummosus]
MTKAEAKDLLLHHAFSHDDFDNPKSQRGFLGMLRPFNGTLEEANYHEIMAALRTLADDLDHPTIDREVVAALWGICHFARAWGLAPEGMLRRNNLISPAQIQQLETWVDSISYATCCLLDGSGPAEAFADYHPPQ